MARNPLSQNQKLVVGAGIVGGLVIVALGTWGPYKNVWVNGMVPVSVMGGFLTFVSVVLLIFGPARPTK